MDSQQGTDGATMTNEMGELVQQWLVQQSGIAGMSCTTVRMGWMVQQDERMVQRDERMVQWDERMVQQNGMGRLVQQDNKMGWMDSCAKKWDAGWCNNH